MLAQVLGWVMSSKAAKVGGGVAVGGSAMVALIFNLHGDVTNRIDKVEAATKQYVDYRNELVAAQYSHLQSSLNDIKKSLETIDKRLYDMKQKSE